MAVDLVAAESAIILRPYQHDALRAITAAALAPEAAAFVKNLRAKDPQLVEDAEELLRLENSVPVSK